MRYRHCPRILDDVGTRPPLQRGVVALGAAEAKLRQQLGIPDVWMRGECLQLMWVDAAGQSKAFAALDLVDDVAYLQGRPQLQAHVLHHHVAVQQKQCSAVNLVSPEEVRVRRQGRVQGRNVPDHVLYAPLQRMGAHRCRSSRWCRGWRCGFVHLLRWMVVGG